MKNPNKLANIDGSVFVASVRTNETNKLIVQRGKSFRGGGWPEQFSSGKFLSGKMLTNA